MRAAVTTILIVLAGCQGWPPRWRAAAEGEPLLATEIPQATTRPAGAEVMARVNDVPIPMDLLYDLLLHSHGATMAWDLILSELISQEAAKHNITVTAADLQAEEAQSMEEAFGFVDDAEQRRVLLAQELARRDISPKQWEMIVRRSAILRKLAGPRSAVSDAELQAEFDEMYSRKVIVRHIQTGSLNDSQEVLKKLRGGKEFAELARTYSTHRSGRDGGLLPPMAEDSSTVPPPILRAALAMKSPGEISEVIQAGTAFHILYLEKVVEAQDVKLADVKEKVEAAAGQRKIRTVRNDILKELIRAAKIEYVHPILKAKAQEQGKP